MEKPTARTIAVYVGSFAFFVACFLLFCYWTFPYERLGEFLVLQVESPIGPDGRRHASQRQLEIIDLSPSWLTGVELNGVRLRLPPDEPDDSPIDVAAEEVTLRAHLLSLLIGDLGGSVSAEVGGGTFEADVTVDGGLSAMGDPAAMAAAEKDIEVTIEEVDLRPLGVMRSVAGIPLEGVLDGTVALQLRQDMADTAGEVDLSIHGLRIGNGTAKLKIPGMGDGITLETIDAGDLTLEMDVSNGLAEVRQLTSNGPDAKLEGSGDIRLAADLAHSIINFLVKVKFEDAYRERSARTRALFSLLDVQPMLRGARTPDGALQFRITGSPSRTFRYEPAGRATGRTTGSAGTGSARARAAD